MYFAPSLRGFYMELASDCGHCSWLYSYYTCKVSWNTCFTVLSVVTFLLWYGWENGSQIESGRRRSSESALSDNKFNDTQEFYSVTGSTVIDDLIYELSDIIISNFVDPWYNHLSRNRCFPNSLKRCACRTLKTLTIRLRRVDWVMLLTRHVVDDIASHFRLFRLAREKIAESKRIARLKGFDPDKVDDLESVFFDLELEMEVSSCRDLISTSPAYESACLHDITDLLLFLLVPSEDFRCRPLRFLVREILIGRVFLPLLDKLTEPQFLHGFVISALSEVKLGADDFLMVIQKCQSVQDLEAILEAAQDEMNLLAVRDNSQLAEAAKKEIQALNQLMDMIKARMKVISPSIQSKPRQQAKEEHAYNQAVQLPLMVVLTNHTAVTFYSDFLAGINKQHYLDCYMAIEGFKSSVEHQLRAIACGSLSDPDLRETMNDAALFLYHQYLSTAAPNRVPVEEVLVNKFLVHMRNDEPSDSWFDHIQARIEEIMTDDRTMFAAFKESPLYRDMLRALDITDEISSTDQLCHAGCVHSLPKGARLFVEVRMLGVGRQQRSGSNFFAVYSVRVRKTNADGEMVSSWNVIRRYSDFHNLNALIKGKYCGTKGIEFPAKKTFNNLKQKFLEKRCQELNHYMSQITQPEVIVRNSGLDLDLLDFLSQQKYMGVSEALPRKIVSAMFNPIKDRVKVIRTVVTQVPDQMTRMGSELNRAATNMIKNNSSQKFSSEDFQRVAASLDLEREDDSIPLRVMLLLANELLGLDSRNQWLRSRVVAALRHFLSAAFGTSLNRRIISFVQEQTNEKHVASWLRSLKTKLKSHARSGEDRNCTALAKVLAQALMLSAMPTELRFAVGTGVAHGAVSNVSQVAEHRALNRRLCYVLLERLLVSVFPEGNFRDIFCTLHSKSPRTKLI